MVGSVVVGSVVVVAVMVFQEELVVVEHDTTHLVVSLWGNGKEHFDGRKRKIQVSKRKIQVSTNLDFSFAPPKMFLESII
jgi:hypothetical protein